MDKKEEMLLKALRDPELLKKLVKDMAVPLCRSPIDYLNHMKEPLSEEAKEELRIANKDW